MTNENMIINTYQENPKQDNNNISFNTMRMTQQNTLETICGNSFLSTASRNVYFPVKYRIKIFFRKVRIDTSYDPAYRIWVSTPQDKNIHSEEQ